MNEVSNVLMGLIFVLVFAAVYYKNKCERLERKNYCSCEGCQNNESGWLSEEYRKKYPNCKMK
jgi:hypothetical protein